MHNTIPVIKKECIGEIYKCAWDKRDENISHTTTGSIFTEVWENLGLQRIFLIGTSMLMDEWLQNVSTLLKSNFFICVEIVVEVYWYSSLSENTKYKRGCKTTSTWQAMLLLKEHILMDGGIIRLVYISRPQGIHIIKVIKAGWNLQCRYHKWL